MRRGRVDRGEGEKAGVVTGVTEGVTATTVGTYCSYSTPGERSGRGLSGVTTRMTATVGVGLGIGTAVRAAGAAGARTGVGVGGAGAAGTTVRAAGATGARTGVDVGGGGAAGTNTSVGAGTGVTIRATVCFVVRQLERMRSAAPATEAKASNRLKRPESYLPPAASHRAGSENRRFESRRRAIRSASKNGRAARDRKDIPVQVRDGAATNVPRSEKKSRARCRSRAREGDGTRRSPCARGRSRSAREPTTA